MELHELTAVDLRRALARRETDPIELTTHYLERIERFNAELGAFVTTTPERALSRARTLGRSGDDNTPLWGIPLGDKDLWRRAGVVTSFGSALMADYVPEQSDDVIVDLDAAGAISLGKTNTPEFGLPPITEPARGPIARNPWDTARTAGGSSGGAAVAVAAGLLPVAPGSDGGGSIRIPAACCGLVGIKPGRGLLRSSSGIESLAGLVVNGPIARSVADAAFLLDALVAPDRQFSPRYSLRAPTPDLPFLDAAARECPAMRIAVVTDSPWQDTYDVSVDPEGTAALELAVTTLHHLGHEVTPLRLRGYEGYSTAFRAIWQGGAASAPIPPEGLTSVEPLTAWLIQTGRALPVADLVDALAFMTAFERRVIEQFSDYDAVLMPALGFLAPPIGSFTGLSPDEDFARQVAFTPFTSLANATGLPALTLPVRVADSGLPVGVQLYGRPGAEATLITIAAAMESSLPTFSALPRYR